jgi:hypothetical protein
MVFNLRCEQLINKTPIKKDFIGVDKATTRIRYFCDAQRDELGNPIPIIECPNDCPFFEDKTS